MKRLQPAPNLAIATLWADMLCGAGVPATVQRVWASSIAGELPPDQSLPEIWLQDDAQLEQARQLLQEWQHLPHRHWACTGSVRLSRYCAVKPLSIMPAAMSKAMPSGSLTTFLAGITRTSL